MNAKCVIDCFKDEFKSLENKFDIIELTGATIRSISDSRIINPGVYVFIKDDEVWRVGRSMKNARWRALQHFQDNTAGKMQKLDGDANATVLLFTIPEPKNEHWILALEKFFEDKLNPDIPPGRNG